MVFFTGIFLGLICLLFAGTVVGVLGTGIAGTSPVTVCVTVTVCEHRMSFKSYNIKISTSIIR